MSTTKKIAQLMQALNRLLFEPEVSTFFQGNPQYPDDDNGPNVPEVKATYERLRGLYGALRTGSGLNQIPFTSATQLVSSAQNAMNAFASLQSNSSDGMFRNFAQTLDAFAHLTDTYGIPYYAAGGEAVDAARTALASDQSALQDGLVKLHAQSEAVQNLQRQVENLITPAIAGSLSNSFTDRRDALKKDKWTWLIVTGVLAMATIGELLYVAKGITETFNHGSAGWQVIVVFVGFRTLLLIPTLILLGFSLGQYRKEREFEEEYAHKAAVALSLPNYGDLLPSGGDVRNQIVKSAAEVIFSSPIVRTSRAEMPTAEVLKATKDMIGEASKFMPWK